MAMPASGEYSSLRTGKDGSFVGGFASIYSSNKSCAGIFYFFVMAASSSIFFVNLQKNGRCYRNAITTTAGFRYFDQQKTMIAYQRSGLEHFSVGCCRKNKRKLWLTLGAYLRGLKADTSNQLIALTRQPITTLAISKYSH